jgi:pyrimidine-nucleoside phosphorylase
MESMYDWIRIKRDGGTLTREQLTSMMRQYVQGKIPDYQMAAFAMATFLRGMTAQETADLTMAMVESGDQVDLSAIAGIKVDKHSTGGVADTTTLVLVPLVAAAGVPVAKMSGRGLGHTGGTIDKLESIPGFRTQLEQREFVDIVNRVKVAVIGQTENLVPADKKLYALRDVTATIDCVPLIASSIMSKKIAAGSDAIVLDVKVGEGAFMKSLEDAFHLAQTMVDIGTHVGRTTIAVVTDMDQPLGRAIGNALEVREAIETLRGNGPKELMDLCLFLGSQMLVAAGHSPNIDVARRLLHSLIESGQALQKFAEWIEAQGGDASVIADTAKLPSTRLQVKVTATERGFIRHIHAERLGQIAMRLGAGRETKESTIDLAVGLILHKKVGESVEVGEPLATLHVHQQDQASAVQEDVLACFDISSQSVEPRQLIFGFVDAQGIHRY